jgi:hypothetical protein
MGWVLVRSEYEVDGDSRCQGRGGRGDEVRQIVVGEWRRCSSSPLVGADNNVLYGKGLKWSDGWRSRKHGAPRRQESPKIFWD